MDIQIIISAILIIVVTAILVPSYLYFVWKAFRMNNVNDATSAARILMMNNVNGGTSVASRTSEIPSMSSDDIKELPCFDYEVGEKENIPVECVVCLENFKGGEKCRMLPICHHTFHVQCIDAWLLKTAACPICRTRASELQTGDSSEVGV